MSDIFKEVDEALKKEKAEQWWQENGKTVIAGCVLAVLVTGITSFGIRWAETNRASDTTSLIEALEKNQVESLLEVAENAPKGVATLARFHAAQTAFDQNEKDKGLSILSALSEDRKVDVLYRDYAALLFVLKQMNDAEADKKKLLEKLAPLTETKKGRSAGNAKNIWRFSALEAQAILLFEMEQREEALKALERLLADDETPEDISLRAQKIAHVMRNM